ncbi:diguanylate cyclase [Novilysobacter erysipheiresistens]|uniref:diguanylate cyclase n=1 Tax=Novilysobacter erysipheiresistens TaxID=1749332 RepID=A0ABU7Z0Z1_9GAMM
MTRNSRELTPAPCEEAAERRVLLIENSRFYAEMLVVELRERLQLEVVVAPTLAAARAALSSGQGFFLALTGLVLADGDHQQIAKLLVGHGVPMVVVTGVYEETARERMARLPVIDYVLKETPGSIDYLVWLVRRLQHNRRITALVVDRSDSGRTHVAALLKLYGFSVTLAADAASGLRALDADPAIRLLVVDHNLPDMDGIEFTRRARQDRPRDMLSIIGSSASAGPSQIARFLKHGASDFVAKPFSREEFFCRISQNIDNLELIGTLQDLATRDYLTGLPNRRRFFQAGAQAMSREQPMAMAMLDIDHFKRVNDTHGHDAGDAALKAVAAAIAAHARGGDVVARYGGEEFCVLAPGMSAPQAEAFFEQLRETVADLCIVFKEQLLKVTVSIGVCHRVDRDLHALLTDADHLLYLAKAGGRNRVVCRSWVAES